jgi:chromate transporter
MMEDEVVKRRGLLSRDQFMDLFGASSLIRVPKGAEIAGGLIGSKTPVGVAGT